MKIPVIIFTTLVVIVIACNNNPSGKEEANLNKKEADSIKAKKPLNIDSIEKVVKLHEPLFQSYWGGMSETEFNIISDYLLSKKDGNFVKNNNVLSWTFFTKNKTYQLT